MTRMLWLGMDQPTFKKQEIGSHRKYSRKGRNGADAETFRQEMALVFDWLRTTLRRGRYACFVVGNSTIRGELVDNTALISQVAQDYRFRKSASIPRRMQDSKKSFNPSIGKIKGEEILVFENEA